MLYPSFWQATSVPALFFLLEQNKEVHTLFSSCEMGCLLSFDCMQFTGGKLQVTYVKDTVLIWAFLKSENMQDTIQGSMEAHNWY